MLFYSACTFVILLLMNVLLHLGNMLCSWSSLTGEIVGFDLLGLSFFSSLLCVLPAAHCC